MSNLSEIQLKIVAGIDGLVEIGKLINELDALGGQTTESSAEVEKLVSTLDNLRQQDQLISEFQTLKKGTADLSSTLDEARTRATSLGKGLADSKQQVASTNAEYRASKSATQALADEWQAAKVKVDLLAKGIKDSTSPTRAQRDELKAAKEQAKLLGEQYKASSKETTTLEKALRSTEQAVKLQTREFNSARKEVNLLDDQYIKQSGTLNGLRTQLQQSGLNTKQLAAEQRSLKAATSQTEQEIAGLADKLRTQAASQEFLNSHVNDSELQLGLYSAAAKQAKDDTEELADQADVSTDGFIEWAKGVMLATAAFFSLERAKAAITDLVQTSASMELMANNAKRAGLEFSELSSFAEDTSLQLNEVMDIAIKTKNYGLDPMSGALQAATDAAAASGKGYEQVDGILTALGQAYTKTKLQQEEMNQLAERGIPAWTLLAEATGKPIPELQDLASAGKLGREEIELLIKAIGTEFAGAAKSAMDNTQGLASSIGDEFTKAKVEVANAGLMQYVNEQMREVLAYVRQLREDGTLHEWGRDAAAAMKSVGDYTRLAASSIQAMAPAIKLMAEAWIALKIVTWLSGLSRLGAGFNQLGLEIFRTSTYLGASSLSATQAAAAYARLGPVMRSTYGMVGMLKTGLIGLGASWGIEKILEAIDAYNKMRAAQEAAEKSQRLVAQTSRQLKDRYAELSKEVGITITNMDQFDQLLADGVIHLDQATGFYKRGAAGIKEIGTSADIAAPLVTKFYDNLAELRKKLSELKPSSEEASKVVTDMFAEMEVGSRTSVSYVISQLTEMGKKGEVTNQTLESGLAATLRKMTTSELSQFQISLSAVGQRLDDVGTKARETGDKLNAELFSRLGLDLEKMRTGFTKVGQDTINVFGQIASSGQSSSAEIRAAFDKAIDSAQTQKEADALIGIYKAAGESGAVSMQDLQKGLDRNGSKTKELTTSTGTLGDAYSELGIKSAEALQDLADKQRSAFDQIRGSTATIEVQRQAFLAYAEAELKAAQASGRYADGSLYAQAASLGLSTELAALQKTVETTGASALVTAGALETMADASDNAKEKSADAGKQMSELEKSSLAVAEGAGSAAAYIGNYSSALQQMARDMSAQTEAMMSNIMGWTRGSAEASSAVATLNQKLADNAAQWREISSAVTLDDIQGHIKDLGLAYLASERAYLKQALAAEKMTAQLTDVDNVTAKAVKRAEGLYKNLDMLDEQDLSGLKSAIDAVRSKMDALEDSARSTLNSLMDELDQYNGALDAVEKRDYETKLADLKAQLDAAKAAQDTQAIADLKKSMDILDQLHKKKMQDIADEAAEKKKAAAEEAAEAAATAKSNSSSSSSNSASASTSTASSSTTPTATKTIELKLGQQSATVQVTPEQEQNLDKLLDQLASAALRTS